MVKKLKDKNAPKRPLSGYLLFAKELRTTNETIKTLSVTKQAGEISKIWKELTEEEKNVYNKKAVVLKDAYKKQVAEYLKSDSYKQFQEKLAEAKGSKTKKRQGNNKMSGYRLFVKENKENIDDGLSADELALKHIAKCGVRWKNLDDKTKDLYNSRANEINESKATGVEKSE